ncbi:ImmA/IrrE family metallo-endopeptidase [Streptomyces sp. NPDC048155]|uniref:ImmA/IrrE family metallo-endopeptidase n=1 Tax=Streptomyces sp. NPDC048155 TaxID=3154818 RepID=UPI0033FF6A29
MDQVCPVWHESSLTSRSLRRATFGATHAAIPSSPAGAHSASRLPARPLVVLTANRADDIYRHRFTAAHELGHLVLHGDATGDSRREKEADAFAARTSLRPGCQGSGPLGSPTGT